ncbi:conjugal transfer protein TraB [Desulfolithobacter dissulfuricans]|uniref:Conjugal transfer protein TraB n=1 Tax=Desulfolithobacter dissulfuricans TaxID=2795293 RepID=A0A915TY06_9BACT|nr:TraB/GumN family protein [Desulfolithobacter dissulfuricans]BCO08078.1 conjugal transfer protein TraB [Desulfolithobacter dissulfuricans]
MTDQPTDKTPSDTPFPSREYPQDATVIRTGDKTILLVGTAHISRHSAEIVEQIIKEEHPDTVCIELDEKRFQALSRRERWENLDLKQVIRNKQLATLMVNLILASYQKKLGGQLGIMPGTELLTAANVATELGIPVELCDRDVRVTLRRAWKATPFLRKGYLLATLIGSLFDKTELDEEKLAELRQKDVLSELMKEIGEVMPQAKEALIDERDIYMAEKIKNAPGKRIVAVVGAGHMAGIERAIHEDNSHRMAEIDTIPPVSKIWKILGWSIPVAIILSIGVIGLRQGVSEAGANALYWVLANGIPSAIGAMIAWAHPATIFSAFAAAPITSLTPVIGAGYVCAFVQVMTNPPVVREFEAVGQDIGSVRGWWRNKLLRVFLVFFMTGFGSSIGTWVGGYRIFTNLFT